MRRLILITLVAGFAVLFAASARGIVGGQLDGARHPGVGFMIGYDETGQSFYGCSGTLVTQRLFVTAAHCTGGQPGLVPSSVRVVFVPNVPLDSDGIPVDPTTYVSGTPVPNPAYSDDGDLLLTFAQIAADIGVVVLDRPANKVFGDVRLYGLPRANFLDRAINRDSFELVGYGLSAGDRHFKTISFDGFRRYASVDANGASLAAPGVLKVRSNPHGADGEDGTACSGDSGGAVLDSTTLVGVISAGDFCSHQTYAARLDTAPAMNFLSRFLGS